MTEASKPPVRVLAIFAHPDDPEFSAGGSMARWADEGAEVYLCIATNGAAGSNDPNQDLEELVRIREAEQRASGEILGLRDVIFLGHADGTMQPTLELRRDLTRLIRQLRPDWVVCSDHTAVFYGDGYINHPDHRAVAEAALYAVFPSAETRPIFPELLAEGLEPHKVKRLYVSGTAQPNTYVDISEVLDRKIEALRCHKSQIDPGDGAWLRERAAEVGKEGNVAYAEAFRLMQLVREETTEAS